jgi:hypothetical protein
MEKLTRPATPIGLEGNRDGNPIQVHSISVWERKPRGQFPDTLANFPGGVNIFHVQ